VTAPHPVAQGRATRYVHEAVVYHDPREYLDLNVPFLRDGVAAGEPTLAVVPREHVDLLAGALGPASGSVRLVDAGEAARNPARLIPLWRKLVDDGGGSAVRGICEPVWSGRRPDELSEVLLHEALVDVAFADRPPLRLRCPYDASALDAAVVDAGCARHPSAGRGGTGDARTGRTRRSVTSSGGTTDNSGNGGPGPGHLTPATAMAEFSRPLPPPGPDVGSVETVEFARLAAVRRLRTLVTERALRLGIGEERAADLVLAAHEVAVNSLRHGGGRGTLRVWTDGTVLVCEISDAGHIEQPLVGRVRPLPSQLSGRGVWLANQLCDLVQLRSSPAGTVVRLHMDAGRR
jgi:anti-sigma regulatory factor (Ser/Thr protein kinase)